MRTTVASRDTLGGLGAADGLGASGDSGDTVARRRVVEAVLADLGSALGSLRCAGSQHLVRLGISMTHFHVLTLLRHHDAMPMGRLADILDTSMSSATGIIDRMEERGLVERVRVPDDRRIVLVRPTKTGLDLVDEAELVTSDVVTTAVARLTDEQLDRLAGAVTGLAAAITAELADVPEPWAVLARGDHLRSVSGGSSHPGHGHASGGQAAHQHRADEAVPASPTPGPAGA